MRIVCLVPGGIGDQILFFPTLDDLKRYYPNAQIDVVVEPRSKNAYRVSKVVHEVLAFDFNDRNSMADWGNLVGNLRDREYDIAIYAGHNWVIGLILWLSGISTRIGYRSQGAFLFTNPVPQKSAPDAAAMYHDLLQGLGINTPCPVLAVSVPATDIDWAETEMKRLGIQSGYVLIDPGTTQTPQAQDIKQVYPVANWQQIIQEFQQKQPDLPVVIVQESEDELVPQILQSRGEVKVTSPPDMGKLAAMIAGADLMVCTDNALMHLGMAVQTYTIALVGASTTEMLPSERLIALTSPTGSIADISPQTVMERIWRG